MPHDLKDRARGWCFTANIPEGEYEILDKGIECTYMIWQYENEGHLHIQGYVYFKNARSGNSLKTKLEKWCGIKAHLEPADGTPQSNAHYCSKPHAGCSCTHCVGASPSIHGPFTVGDCPVQGGRTDVKEFLMKVKEFGLTEEVGMEYAQLALQYGTKAEALVEKWKYPAWKQRTEFAKPRVIVIYGTPGSGKSWVPQQELHAAEYCDEGAFPWNEYRGEETVLYDEFDGSIKLSRLLKEIDGHRVTVSQKNKPNAPFIPKVVYICSNASPKEWYPFEKPVRIEALLRRVDEIWHYEGKWPDVVKTKVK